MRKLQALRTNSMHAIIGFVEIAIGLHLIFHDSYFQWPPFFVGLANDDIVGGFFVLLGAIMMYWVFDPNRSTRMDHALLVASSTCMALLTFYQLLHVVVLGIDMPWISNAALTLMIVQLAQRSNSV